MKKQTLILVAIGVLLFLAGSVIAFASVEGASKHASSGANSVAPTVTSVVVAKSDIPAGTTGNSMVSAWAGSLFGSASRRARIEAM